MLEQLSKYFGGDGYYNWGVKLLRELGGDVSAFERYCKQSFTPPSVSKQLDSILEGHFRRLQAEMSVISNISTPQKAETPQKHPQTVVEKPSPSVSTHKTPELAAEPPIIAALRMEEEQCRNDRKALHLTLETTENAAERGEKCLHIRTLSDRINAIWDIIEAYEFDGTLPALGSISTEKTAAEEAVDLMLRIGTLKPRLCVLKRLLSNDLGITKQTRYLLEQRAKTAELNEVLEKLATIKNGKNEG